MAIARTPRSGARAGVPAWTVAGLLRAALLALVWVFITGASTDYAVYGAVSVAAATALSLALMPPSGPVRPLRWPRRVWFSTVLCLWFLGQSVVGGVDVAVRALRRPVRIAPEVVRAPVDLPAGHARQLAMLMMNLMPGSMIQRSEAWPAAGREQRVEEYVELHTLSESLQPADQWRQLQHRVGQALD